MTLKVKVNPNSRNKFVVIGEVSAQLKKLDRWDIAREIARAVSHNASDVDEAILIIQNFVEVETSTDIFLLKV